MRRWVSWPTLRISALCTGTVSTITVIAEVGLIRPRAHTVAVALIVIAGIHAIGSAITIGAAIVMGRGATRADHPDLACTYSGCLRVRGQPFLVCRSLRL